MTDIEYPLEVSITRIGLPSTARTVATPWSSRTSWPFGLGSLPSGPPPTQTADT